MSKKKPFITIKIKLNEYLNEYNRNLKITIFYEDLKRFSGEKSMRATQLYMEIASKNNLSLTQMSLAFVNSQPFVTSNIIGATTMEQLKENIGTVDIDLSDEIIKKINLIHANNPNPTP